MYIHTLTHIGMHTKTYMVTLVSNYDTLTRTETYTHAHLHAHAHLYVRTIYIDHLCIRFVTLWSSYVCMNACLSCIRGPSSVHFVSATSFRASLCVNECI